MSSGESSDAKSIQRNPVQPQPPVYSMRLVTSSDGTAMYKSKSGNSPPPHPGGEGGGDGNSGAGGSPGLGVSTGEPFKRKRGRPRKYGSNGTVVVPLTTVSPTPSASALPLSSSAAAAAAAGAMKKVRGRPAGSSKKQRTVALGSAGIGFTPHIIAIKTGEDIASKIMAFSQQGPQAVCILSASGAVSNVTLRQAATSGGTVTYEGRFEILSLSGSFMLSENGGQRSRTGGLSVCLAGPDGRVLGGGVAGLLTAASPVQVVAGSFIADGKKETTKMNPSEPVSAPGKLAGPVGVSQGTASESSDGPGSSLNQSIGACNNSNQQDLSNMPWQ
ncbi:AT-hook motif nuclear-localized protein 10-like [Phoenix dactylifera]|uniref:AT-hook motif nuclear-localized protein n=1 Tax=Phoenix dactylifera TaxID=42345 RepID=A0A8B7BWY3_PHODC|nr:AT-hook motif nuclear-localized protein 10-like [Phoenix dactylifera]XP_008787038.2 AT-hook motif nuclear-localized protein 10-like [Phoenix dactylifera]XP_008787039.2 AT-hook motif nuclear-localized protein 10-like [Phoenix dactylifera]